MKRKIKDPKVKMFIEFFSSQGVKFIDSETGEELEVEDDNETED